jgi:TPR repeat protein
MSRRAITIAPILVGAAAGGLLAWFGANQKATPKSYSPPTEARMKARPAAASAPPIDATPANPVAAEPRAAAAPAASSATSSATPPADSAPPRRALSPVFDLSAPSTQPDLMTAQLGCNRQIPEDCERAGRSLESGSAGMTDAARARGLLRIALTLYVKQCESTRVAACLRLAEMYDAGEIVQANPKNAEALRGRAKTLCMARPNDADCRR